jgi:hypothetical protein
MTHLREKFLASLDLSKPPSRGTSHSQLAQTCSSSNLSNSPGAEIASHPRKEPDHCGQPISAVLPHR